MVFSRYFLQARLYSVFFIVLFSSFFTAFTSVQAGTGELTYEKFFRLNNPPVRSDSGDWLGLAYETDAPTDNLDTFLMADTRFYFQDSSFNYSIQEAYIKYANSDYSFTVGRKILDWNENEKYWSLGYLNANQAFTLLSTEEEGVTGILYNKKWGAFDFDILLSYVFIPQVNPEYDFKNGEVVSKSEWVRLPPRRTVVSGLEVPIYYKDADYSVSDIIFNKSIGGNIRYKWEKGGASAFAIYKPENTLRINASAFYDNVTLNQVVVEPDPTVNHHAYYGVQLYHAFGDVRARGGLSYVDPNARLGKDFPIEIRNARQTFKSEFFNINPRYEKEAYAHGSLNLDRRKYHLSLNYIHLLTENVRGSDDFFSDTVKWKSTFGGSIRYFFNDYFDILVDLKYDVVRKDNILKSEIKYNFRNRANIALGFEVLKAPADNSYWSYYRASDTLYSAIGFVF